MTKGKLFIVLSIVLTLFSVVPSYALTTAKVRGQNSYTKSIKGSLGYYHAYSTGATAKTYVRNDVVDAHYYTAAVSSYNYSTCETKSSVSNNKTLKLGESFTRSIARDPNSYAIDYYHRAYGYASSSSASGKIDALEYDAIQYYRD